LASDIEEHFEGGINAFKHRGDNHSRLLSGLLDQRLDIDGGELYGVRGSDICVKIGKYVDCWKNYSKVDYLEKVLYKLGVPLADKRAKKTAKATLKKAAITTPKANSYRDKGDDSSLSSGPSSEDESSGELQQDFSIEEITTRDKKGSESSVTADPEVIEVQRVLTNMSLAGASGVLFTGKFLACKWLFASLLLAMLILTDSSPTCFGRNH
jgi:hypothetical protein